MFLNKELLETIEEYPSCLNALGLYDSMQFVLRLRPDIRTKVDALMQGYVNTNNIDFDSLQAYSTFVHETIHWWQHIGSTSGFILSLSYPSQMHINHTHLLNFLKHSDKKKSINKYNILHGKAFHPDDQTEEFHVINQILNNYHDIQFYKNLLIQPKYFAKFINDPLFESIGNCFHITYHAFISTLSSTFEDKSTFLPNLSIWAKQFTHLTKQKIHDHYHGSPVYLMPFGLKEIYEGQARFTQIQMLNLISNKTLQWSDFKNLGMLEGEYFSAFETFLKYTLSEMPENIDDPLVPLFLLICDIAINPTEGFPFDINNFEMFTYNSNPSYRFFVLCKAIVDEFPEMKSLIKECSSAEYIEITNKLCIYLGWKTPLDAAKEINRWTVEDTHVVQLMKEELSFEFSEINLPIRLLFSRFIRFQQDKLKDPAFFCWPGYYLIKQKNPNVDAIKLFNEHHALFQDKAEGGIYSRKFDDKPDSNVFKTFNSFYGGVILYDLCKQWITEDGTFKYDYSWLTYEYSRSELKSAGQRLFKSVFEVDPDDFELL